MISDVLSRVSFASAQAATEIGSSSQDPGVASRDPSTSVAATTSDPTWVPPMELNFMLTDIACRYCSDSDPQLKDADEGDISKTDSISDDLQLYWAQDLDAKPEP